MKIQFLGTAAYDAMPALFCNCETCKKARSLGGRNIRSRTQSIIDDRILIDFNADTAIHFLQYNIDFNKITDCLITHSHSDHFYPEDMAIAQYAHDNKVMNYYSSKDGYDKMNELFTSIPGMKGKYKTHLIQPNDRFKIDKYDILAVKANHGPSSSPLIYAISDGNKKMLYAHDTSTIFSESIESLKTFGKFDFVSIDCTGGSLPHNWLTHMTIKQVKEQIKVFKKEGMIDDNTIIVLNHFSHNGHANYDDMVEVVKGTNLQVSYDGMIVEF